MEWPSRFVYVCSASNAAIVNVLPILHGGIERIDRIIIFCGAESDEVTDARTRREAIEPADRLVAFALQLAANRSLPPPPIGRRWGDPNRLEDWIATMRSLSEDSGSATIVFNLSGGTRAMAIGGILGMGGDRPDRVLIYVSGTPPRTEFLVGVSQHEAPRQAELDLANYLAAYGMRELASEARAEREALYRAHRKRLLGFGGQLIQRAGSLVPALRRQLGGLRDETGRFQPGIVSVAGEAPHIREALTIAFSHLAGFPGLLPAVGGWHVEDPLVEQLLDSGWLEGYLFLRLADMFADRDDVSVHANVHLGYVDDPGAERLRERGEIDVALLIRSQLHLVEAKTASFSGRDAAERTGAAFAKTESLKRELVGPLGCCFVVNPRDNLEWLRTAPGNFVTRAASAGIELMLGRTAATDLRRRVEGLAPP